MLLKPGDPVVMMGPTGTPTEIPEGETVILAGGGLGNAVLFSIGQAMRRAGNRVLYFAGYKHMTDRYKIAEIEAASDAVVWCCDEEPGFTPDRPQDRTFVGNIVQGMHAYASGALGEQPIPFNAADRIIAIGSDRMMAAVARARHDLLKRYPQAGPPRNRFHQLTDAVHDEGNLRPVPAAARGPETSGKVSYVFSCFNQDQPLDRVDWTALDAAAAPELGAGKAHRRMDRPLPGRARRARHAADLTRPRYPVSRSTESSVPTTSSICSLLMMSGGDSAMVSPVTRVITPFAKHLRKTW